MTNMTTYRLTESKLRRLISEAMDSARIQACIEQEYGGYERGLTWSTLYVEMAADYMAKELGMNKRAVLGELVNFIENRLDGTLWNGRDSQADVHVSPQDSRDWIDPEA